MNSFDYDSYFYWCKKYQIDINLEQSIILGFIIVTLMTILCLNTVVLSLTLIFNLVTLDEKVSADLTVLTGKINVQQ